MLRRYRQCATPARWPPPGPREGGLGKGLWMTILHDAAGPAVLAVNMPSPSSLLSGYALGLFAIVFAETGRAGRGPRGLIARLLARRRRASRSSPGRNGP
jgi:hypothetical protein